MFITKKETLAIFNNPLKQTETESPTMSSARQWWRRVAAAVKDKHSICMTMASLSRRRHMEAAVIRATSHSDRSVDYKNAGRVFAWARTSPSFMAPIMWAIARRAERTRSWPVALKCLLLAHGLLLISPTSNTYNGRLPFDLGDFRDRSSSNSSGFSAFVHAYFQFLDNRAILLSINNDDDDDVDDDCGMNQVRKLQTLLDLLMQIRPYADGMNTRLILEAMDCAVIEIFEVYSGICNGIASFLVSVLGSRLNSMVEIDEEERKRRGLKAIRVLKRASEQSVQLKNYFDVCKSLGVLRVTEFIPLAKIPDEDIKDLERLVLSGVPQIEEKANEKENCQVKEEEEKVVMMDLIQLEDEHEEEKKKDLQLVPLDWVVFDDEFRSSVPGYYGNPFVYEPTKRQRATMVHCNGHGGAGTPWTAGNLIELM